MTLAILCSLVVFSIASSEGEVPSPARPNVVFFIVDDAFAEMLNYCPEGREPDGRAKNLTPHLDKLVAEGTVFNRQQIPSSVCTPSRFSCLTGLYANRSPSTRENELCLKANMTLVSWSAMLKPEMPTLPKELQSAGYFTGMAGKCHFTGYYDPTELASDSDPTDIEVSKILKDNYASYVTRTKEFGFDSIESFYRKGQVHDHPVAALRQHNMDWIAHGGLQLIDQAVDSGKPFYLYIATTLPHTPCEDELSWNADPRVTPKGMLAEPCRVLPDRKTIPDRLIKAGLPVDSGRAMMLAIDDALGALIDKLEETEKLDNTIIIFFNDNGQSGKGTVYEGGITCPSVFWRKGGFSVGSESDALISNIDFAPTIAEWAEIESPSYEFDGISLSPLLNGDVEKVRDSVFAEMGFARAVRKGDWKYVAIRYPENIREIPYLFYEVPNDPTSGERPTFGQMAVRPISDKNARAMFGMRESASRLYPDYWDPDQLYYLQDDPNEQKNLAADPKCAEKLAEMKNELSKFVADIPGEFGEFKSE